MSCRTLLERQSESHAWRANMGAYLRKRLVIAASGIFLLVGSFRCPLAAASGEGAQGGGQNKARRHQPWEEADDDAVFAAAVLGELHDTVKAVGTVFRVVGDTAGALTGGSIKAVGAMVNGVSSVLDEASRRVDSKPKANDISPVENQDQYSAAASTTTSRQHDRSSYQYDGKSPSAALGSAAGDTNGNEEKVAQSHGISSDSGKEKAAKGSAKGAGSTENPDPINRVETVVRTSVAGSLRLMGAAVKGVGEAVFQAGAVAEGLAGGTGMVAEDLVRVVQGALYIARDDIKTLSKVPDREAAGSGHENSKLSRKKLDGDRTLASTSLSSEGNIEGHPDDKRGIVSTALSLLAATLDAAKSVWQVACALMCLMGGAALREAVQLFRHREGGAPPVAPRFAVLLTLALGFFNRRRLRKPSRPPASPAAETTSAAGTPRLSSPHHQLQAPAGGLRLAPALSPSGLDGNNRNHPLALAASPTTVAAVATGLSSPSQSLLLGSPGPLHGTTLAPPRPATASPPRGPLQMVVSSSAAARLTDYSAGVDPSLPSPAQQARGRSLLLLRGPDAGREQERNGAAGVAGMEGGEDALAARATGVGEATTAAPKSSSWWRPWTWQLLRKFKTTSVRAQDGGRGARFRWVWLVLLWFVASVLEERERDRVAWLAWDEGFRKGQASRVFDSSADSETTAWLNHLMGSLWGDGATVEVVGRRSSNRTGGGLSSYFSESMANGVLEALEEFKPTSVVGVELQEVNLGSVAPQILGVAMLDPASPYSPGGGYISNERQNAKKFVSLRVDLELATRDLRVGVGVKLSNLEKALLPTGNIRLLEVYFRANVSVRLEVRDEYPYVGSVLVAFDGIPEVRVRMEQWGLDALTLGSVDEWVRIGVRQAMRPYVLPGFLEIDATEHLCPECAIRSATSVAGNSKTGRRGGPIVSPLLQRSSSAASMLSNGPSPVMSKVSDITAAAPVPTGEPEPLRRAPPAAAVAAKAVASAVASASYFPEPKTENVVRSGKPLRGGSGTAKGDGRLATQGKGRGGAGGNGLRWFGAGKRPASGGPACEPSVLDSGVRSTGEEALASPPCTSEAGDGSSLESGCQAKEREPQRVIGRAAEMSHIHENRGGMGGALHWIKERLSNRIGGGGEGGKRRRGKE